MHILGPSYNTKMVHWSFNLPIYMYVMLHAHKWHVKNHRYVTIYHKDICYPKNKHRRLSTTINCIHNWNDEIPPEDTSFFYMVMQQKCNQSDCPDFSKKRSSSPYKKFTITPNATTESEWKYSTTKNHQHTSTRSEGGTSFATSEGANIRVITHTVSKRSSFNNPQLGLTFKLMD